MELLNSHLGCSLGLRHHPCREMALALAQSCLFVLSDLILHAEGWVSVPKDNVWVLPTATSPHPLAFLVGQRADYNDINWLELHKTSLFNSQTPGSIFCFVFNFQIISLCPAGFPPSSPLSLSLFISYFPLAGYRQWGGRNLGSQGAVTHKDNQHQTTWKYFTPKANNP